MTKVQKISQTLTPFGRINFINKEFGRSGLAQLIDNHLGYRQSTKGYKHSDIVRTWFNIFFCGGYVAEDQGKRTKIKHCKVVLSNSSHKQP
jgi:hypothetical protein